MSAHSFKAEFSRQGAYYSIDGKPVTEKEASEFMNFDFKNSKQEASVMLQTARTDFERQEAIKAIDQFGLFSMEYISDKRRDLKASEKTHSLIKRMKVTINLTKRDYEDIVLKGEREAKGTYAVPVSDNKLLFKHKEKEEYYVRFYRLPNAVNTMTLNYYVDGKEVDSETWEEKYGNWAIPSAVVARNEDRSVVYNIKLENIKRLKHGDVEVIFE